MAGGEQGAEQARAELDWRSGIVPVSRMFDDPYFSIADGLAETRHVFLAGNGLPARLRPGFAIAELGFGTGLNLLATRIACDGLPGPVRYTSFEAYPMDALDIARAMAAFPEALAVSADFLTHWAAGARQFRLGALEVEVVIGNVRDTLPAWSGLVDAWYLDGFSPAKNPQMWSDNLMAQVAVHTAPQGTFATYTAAGHVRRALSAAGFTVTRKPGHGTKRHMTTGIRA